MSLIQTRNYFNPLELSNCALWLDGSDPFGTGKIPPNLSTIARWTDKSPNKVAFSTSGAPTFSTGVYNNNGLIVFNGSTMLVNSSFNYFLPTRTLFLVAQQTVYNNNNCGILSFASGTSNDANLSNTISYNTGYFGGSAFQIVSQFPGIFFNYTAVNTLTPFGLYSDTNAAQQEIAFVNGQQQFLTNYPTAAGNSIGLTIGCRVNDPARFFFGYIGEVIIYNYTLPIAQRQQVEGYLAQKWGIRSALPDDHLGKRVLYYNLAQTANIFFSPYELGRVGANVASLRFTRKFYVYSPSNFFPTLFGSGLLLWLDGFDPNTIITSGNAVTQWRDKSGYSNNAITQSPTGPIWKPWNNDIQNTSITFDGNNYMQINKNFMSTLNGSMFAVFRAPTAVPTQPQMVIQNQGAWSMPDFQLQPTQFVVSTLQSSIVSQFVTPVTNYAITSIEIIKQQSTINTFLNGSLSQSVKFSSFYSTGDTFDLPNIGRYTSSGIEAQDARFVGDLQEIIVYNSTLTTGMRQAVEGYLAWKWFLQSNLPNVHPYYTIGPTCNAAYIGTPPTFTLASIQAFPNLLTHFDFSRLTGGSGAAVTNFPATFSASGKSFSMQGSALVATSVLSNLVSPTSNTTLNFTTSHSLQMEPRGTNYQNAFTIIALQRIVPGTNRTFMQGDANGSGTGFFLGYYNGGKRQWYKNFWIMGQGGPGGSNPQVDGVWDLDVFIGDSALNYTFRQWGSNYQTYSGGGQGYQGISLNVGYNWGNSTAQMQELFVFNCNISSNNYIQIEGYLAWKYGLQSNLVMGHPYKNLNPNGSMDQTILASAAFSGGGNSLLLAEPSAIRVFLQASSYSGSGTWDDLSTNGRNAFVERGTIAKNANGNGIVLNGSTNWQFPNVGVGNAWTVGFWYYNVGGWGGLAQIVCQMYAGGPMAINIGQWNIMAPSFYGLNEGPVTPYTSYTTWTHFTATWSGSIMTSYINGVFYASNAPGGTATDGGQPYRIGARWDSADFVNGVIGELRIYNVVLTPAQVLQDYTNTVSLYPAGTT
jgi:hypothetical protein